MLALLAGLTLGQNTLAQQGPASFVPDWTFQGSQLTGWQQVGQADWRAENGVITGTARADGSGGWLLVDRSYQDVEVFSRFRCAADCDAGILLRAQQTPEGMQGVYVSLNASDLGSYRVTIDPSGRIITRVSVRGGGGAPGGAGAAVSGAGAGGAGPAGGAPGAPGGGGGGTGAAQTSGPPSYPPLAIRRGDWNSVEVILDANSIGNHYNAMRNAVPGGQVAPPTPIASATLGGAVVGPDTSRFGFGRIALYVGSGTVRFDNFALKDLLLMPAEPAERISARFRVQKLNDFYYGWGADAADIDRDGSLDVISGPYIYYGPSFAMRREYYPAHPFNPGREYINDMITFATDWTGDGWIDVLNTERRPMVLFVNPGNQSRRWDRHVVLPEVCSETTLRADVDSDGKPDVVMMGRDGRVAYGHPNPASPTAPWIVRKVSEPVFANGCNAHGLGTGDVNGDGRRDILALEGWWEQPASAATHNGNWTYHKELFGDFTRPSQHPGGAEISVYDFNGDGLNDVVTSTSAHGWGLAWFEQKRDALGSISFVRHHIMGDFSTRNAGDVTFSEVHSGATLVDIDRDGIQDFVAGKRHWAHLDAQSDPDPDGPAVIYWYRTVRNANAPGGVEFVPELIHNRSGVGSEVKAIDVNRDGAMDLLTSGTRGTFIFWGVGADR